MANFPSQTPKAEHLRKQQPSSKEAWGFASSGFRSDEDEDMEARVRGWCATETANWKGSMQKIDSMERSRSSADKISQLIKRR
jgi:hypothetical protein